jgi:SAM-dependent methyltransferase
LANEADAKVRYKVMLDIINYDTSAVRNSDRSIMDFGCGLGHLYQYIRDNNYNVKYCGVDISDVFLTECKRKFPDVNFVQMDILKDDYKDLVKSVDYVVMNGVFTEKCTLEYREMKMYFEKVLKRAFEICNRGIAFNVMSKDVDWERDDLFHLPLGELSSFLTKDLSRKYVVRNDYGLYEYTTYVYKD